MTKKIFYFTLIAIVAVCCASCESENDKKLIQNSPYIYEVDENVEALISFEKHGSVTEQLIVAGSEQDPIVLSSIHGEWGIEDAERFPLKIVSIDYDLSSLEFEDTNDADEIESYYQNEKEAFENAKNNDLVYGFGPCRFDNSNNIVGGLESNAGVILRSLPNDVDEIDE